MRVQRHIAATKIFKVDMWKLKIAAHIIAVNCENRATRGNGYTCSYMYRKIIIVPLEGLINLKRPTRAHGYSAVPITTEAVSISVNLPRLPYRESATCSLIERERVGSKNFSISFDNIRRDAQARVVRIE